MAEIPLFIYFILAIIGVAVVLLRRRKRTVSSDNQPAAIAENAGHDLAVKLARTTERLAEIDAFYANELNSIEIQVGACGNIPSKSFKDAAVVMVEKITGESRNSSAADTGNTAANIGLALGGAARTAAKRSSAAGALNDTVLRRTLRDMSDGERAILRLADMLNELGQLQPLNALKIRVPIIWNKGSCFYTTSGYEGAAKRSALQEGLMMLLGAHFGDVATSSELVQTALRNALSPDSSLAEHERHLFEAYLFEGSRWLSPADAYIASPSPSALMLGVFDGTSQDLLYDRRESLITIAPPGAGKSQAHVLRNLLHLRAPAVVLDIKGEAFKATARWRQENVGRLFAFAPTMPTGSMHYNPLDAVGDDPGSAWDDARRLADLLVVPQRSDPYFESRARDLLTVSVLDVALTEPSGRRNMHSVLDRLYLTEEQLASWCDHLELSGVPQLARQATALRVMPERQREGIFDSARNHVEVWQSPALASLIDRSDWSPNDLRTENGTLYLCVNLEDVKKYASVLRVVIGQTASALCRGEAEANAPVVTFFVDELPRLGRMDVIEEALDVGRGYGLRLWLFCQNTGQLRTAYPNADGMIGNCAARCYMDPDDESAEELSRYLGQRKGLLDGRQKPLAEPTELKGPAFADKVIVFLRGKSPAKLMRTFAYGDPTSRSRMQETTRSQSALAGDDRQRRAGTAQ